MITFRFSAHLLALSVLVFTSGCGKSRQEKEIEDLKRQVSDLRDQVDDSSESFEDSIQKNFEPPEPTSTPPIKSALPNPYLNPLEDLEKRQLKDKVDSLVRQAELDRIQRVLDKSEAERQERRRSLGLPPQ